MKKVMFALCLMLGAAVAVNAQDTTSTSGSTGSSQSQTQVGGDDAQTTDQSTDQEKELIASSELPAAVRTQLESQDYSGWTVGNAYKKEKDGQIVYAVEMSNGSEKKMVKFDAQGNKLKEKEKKEDQK